MIDPTIFFFKEILITCLIYDINKTSATRHILL